MNFIFPIILSFFVCFDAWSLQFEDANGVTFTEKNYSGKWVLFNFWAPWCPICRVEVKDLNQLNQRKDLSVIGVVVDYGDPQSALSTIERWGMKFDRHVLAGGSRDPSSPIHQIGPLLFYPTTYLMSPRGDLVMKKAGPITTRMIEAFIRDYRPSFLQRNRR